MLRIAGLDLNGWHDFACRGWETDIEYSTDIETTEVDRRVERIVDGGLASVIVSDGDLLVGGPQAILSPIGLGVGWGDIGAPTSRRRLADLLDAALKGKAFDSYRLDLRAACDALTHHAQEMMLCIPDRHEMDEARQQAVIDALSGPKRPRVTLLWRSVAILLDWLDDIPSPSACAGQRIACLTHVSDGIEVQYFTLRALEKDGGLLAPERNGSGRVEAPPIGLRTLRDDVYERLLALRQSSGAPTTGHIRLADDILLQEPDAPNFQIIRNDRGRWERLTSLVGLDVIQSKLDIAPLRIEADLVLISTPLASRLHDRLLRYIDTGAAPVRIMPHHAPARGALRAAQRIKRGVAHYLDHLDQVSLAVLRRDEPCFEDLIRPGEVVAGNKEYLSPVINQMMWQEGMERAKFFIRKGVHEIRRWEVDNIPAPDRRQGLEIRLRQRPAQGWAQIAISAPDWEYLRRNPIQLDWEKLVPEERDETAILNELRPKPPSRPERIRYMPAISLWDNTFSKHGLSALLAATAEVRYPSNLEPLVRGFRRRDTRDGVIKQAIGTDGEMPVGLSDVDLRNFDNLREKVARRLLDDKRLNRNSIRNDDLLFLTWLHGRCSREIVNELCNAIDAHLKNIDHPWLAPRSAAKVALHGAARVVRNSEDIERLIPSLLKKIDSTTAFNDYLAALASIMAKPVEAPFALARIGVEPIASCLVTVWARLNGSYSIGSRTKYALMAVAGLLRVREVEPWALLCARSDIARDLANQIEGLCNVSTPLRFAKTKESAVEILKMLQGDGGRSDVLSMIEEIDSE